MEVYPKTSLRELKLHELQKEKEEKKRYNLILSIAFIGISICALLLVLQTIELTGRASDVVAKGGYITELVITQKIPVTAWGGIYGLVMRVPGFTQQLYKDVPSGEIERSDSFFDCIKNDATGGPEVYASMNSTIDFTSLTPGTTQMIDDFIGCSGRDFCAVNTFTKTMSIYLGNTEISNIPTMHTYKYNGDNEVFDVGILTDSSGKLIFVSHINASMQGGFFQDYPVNYQMMLPTQENQTHRYYFFNDPFDVCPAGGIGNIMIAYVSGYTRDIVTNATLSGVNVSVNGYITTSDVNGYYSLNFSTTPGPSLILAQKSGYDPYHNNISVDFTNFNITHDIYMSIETPATQGDSISPIVFGVVTDSSGSYLENVFVAIGNTSTLTNASGEYYLRPTLTPKTQPIIAIKVSYNNYYELINFTANTTLVEHNIIMSPANENIFPTGPFPQGPFSSSRRYDIPPTPEVVDQGKDFWVSAKEIKRQVRQNTFIEEGIAIYNFKSTALQLVATVSPEISDFIILQESTLIIPGSSPGEFVLIIYGRKPVGKYRGTLSIRGDIEQDIPIEIDIVEKKLPIESILMKLDLFNKVVSPGSELRYRLELQNLLTEQSYKVKIDYMLMDRNETSIAIKESEEVELGNMLTLLKSMDIPKNITEGKYLLRIDSRYFDTFSSVSAPVTIARPLYMYSFFGIPLWIIFILIALMSFIALNMFIYKLRQEKKKRYHLTLEENLLPKPGPRSIKIGKIAETNIPAYIDLDMLCTHAIVAGATGGGKSVTAQVIVEEALMKNIAVVVFDPTAQWSGMLRKCEDKRMLGLYSKYGLKPSDARGFPGNVRQITNAHEAIDIKKYINPGQIQVFACNKLDPSEMDTFVSTAIVSIFRSGPEEHPGLRVLLVFDEVHRLLPKFGGTGKGFLQIERACREFRKWGFGVFLVSQVLSDFVGEIKANINTEALMRVAEESDLERVKERYGPESLRSLVRADVGVGMVQNAEYNRGMPYFVAFRPLLHNTRRLGDDILQKYNSYNDVIDDLEYQISQLEEEKVDVFDLRMELKLVKDKLMSGNFTVVDIYLEGLKPRVDKQWQAIGKKPKALVRATIEEKDLSAQINAAQKERDKWNAQAKAAQAASEVKKEDIRKKLHKSLTLDNGMMISTFQELIESLPAVTPDIYAIHVSEKKNKNDFADWVTKEFDAVLGGQIKSAKSKDEMLSMLKAYKTPDELGTSAPAAQAPATSTPQSPSPQTPSTPVVSAPVSTPAQNPKVPESKPSSKKKDDVKVKKK